jgi:hypothetical protein
MESLVKVSEIWPVIDELISEEITASLPEPIGDISISTICAEIRDFVVQWLPEIEDPEMTELL